MTQFQTDGRDKTKRLALCGMMAALGLIFSYVEAMIPISVGIPGVKLGVANLVIIVALYVLGGRYAFSINVIRILVAGLLFNGAFGALYSLAGACVSFVVMSVLKKTGWFSIVGVSMAGGVAHNVGQILVAAAIIENLRLFMYFPVLLASGMVTGIVIGVVAYAVMNRLKILQNF